MSVSPPEDPHEFLDVDAATLELISRLTIADIAEIHDTSKGKRRADAAPTDPDCALAAYAAEVEQALLVRRDRDFAASLDAALATDQPMLDAESVLERAVRDDRVAAEALGGGRPMPQQSEVQKLMEDPEFLVKSQIRDSVAVDVTEDSLSEASSTAVDLGPNSEVSSLSVAKASSQSSSRVECIICGDVLHAQLAFNTSGPCAHFYCRACLNNLVRACLGDESLFPLKCCQHALPLDGPRGVLAQLDLTLRMRFQRKAVEMGTLASDRLYCPLQTCSAFLGSVKSHPADTVTCLQCGTAACARCKQHVHLGQMCRENEALAAVRALAQEQRWQTCPGCAQIIELRQGCFHMTCRCGTHFCYVCAARWKTCACPQWEERHLITTAELRVEHEMGARARQVEPQIFRQRVQQRVQQLRYDHDCANGHRWRRRDGRARCEECHFMLPEYLLLCRSCGIAVCVRCARNRL